MKARLKRCTTWLTMAAIGGGGAWYFVPFLMAGQSVVFVAGAAATLAVVGGMAPRPPDPDEEKP